MRDQELAVQAVKDAQRILENISSQDPAITKASSKS
jgi:hypothetical protein